MLRPAYDQPLHVNKRQADGEPLLSRNPLIFGADAESSDAEPLEFDPYNMVGYEFVHDKDGNQHRAKVTDYFKDQDKHMISLCDGYLEEIVSYSQIIDAVNKRMGD